MGCGIDGDSEFNNATIELYIDKLLDRCFEFSVVPT